MAANEIALVLLFGLVLKKQCTFFTQQVAFHQFYFVDNGKTAVVQTSRVSADYQGTGMWKVFRKYQLLLLEQFPNVTHVAYTSGQKKLHIQRWKDGKTGSKFIMSRVSLFKFIFHHPLSSFFRFCQFF